MINNTIGVNPNTFTKMSKQEDCIRNNSTYLDSSRKAYKEIKSIDSFKVSLGLSYSHLRTEARALPPLKISTDVVKECPEHLDFSSKTLDEVRVFLHTDSAQEWCDQYVAKLEAGSVMPMPAMKYTQKQIQKVMSYWISDYPLTENERICVFKLMQSLYINGQKGYPSYPSEQLARFFSIMRDVLTGKYFEFESIEDEYLQERLKGLKKAAKGVDLLNLVSKVWQHDKPTKLRDKIPSPIEDIFFENDYLCSFQTKSVRILSMDELSIGDFNKTAFFPLNFIGVLNEKPFAYHDAQIMFSNRFMMHDGYHACEISGQIKGFDIRIFQDAVECYFKKMRVQLDTDTALLMDYLIFEATHESLLLHEDHAKIVLHRVLHGFDFHTDYSATAKIRGIYLSWVPTQEELRLANLLKDKSMQNRLEMIYSTLNREVMRAVEENDCFRPENLSNGQ